MRIAARIFWLSGVIRFIDSHTHTQNPESIIVFHLKPTQYAAKSINGSARETESQIATRIQMVGHLASGVAPPFDRHDHKTPRNCNHLLFGGRTVGRGETIDGFRTLPTFTYSTAQPYQMASRILSA